MNAYAIYKENNTFKAFEAEFTHSKNTELYDIENGLKALRLIKDVPYYAIYIQGSNGRYCGVAINNREYDDLYRNYPKEYKKFNADYRVNYTTEDVIELIKTMLENS